MVINETIIPGVLAPLAEAFRDIIGTLSWLIGGIFGIYLILLIIKWWQNRIIISLLRDIRFDMDKLNEYLKIDHSEKEREGKFEKYYKKIIEKE